MLCYYIKWPYLHVLQGNVSVTKNQNIEMNIASVKFPISASCRGINSDITKRLAFKRPCNLHGMSFKSIALRKSWVSSRISAIGSKGDSNNYRHNSSPAEKVDEFYICINEKKLKQLGECVSRDACFYDFAFTKPFKGKKEVMQFLEQLSCSMGKNVKFKVRQICQGQHDDDDDDDGFTAAANWHLEWKEEQIPFTRGCSFFKLSRQGENIVIRRAEIVIESPIKPGGIVLTLLKTLTSLFDDFPQLAEWFLRSPHAILRWIMKIYNIFVAPLVTPLLDGYIRLWSITVRLFSYAFNILIFISKYFIK
ncbi:uncharacterized protein LOC107488133 [Arachis duranensis]|uniref:Uncharacterized protein LOC107488133 n=2 Tax=Arachis TaxID=3817 RepID=A0A6P4D947_ARADU|nr:uncharacterized protein LOC107488133 [Arachis duranensis]